MPQEIYGTAEGLINMTRLDDPDELLLHSSGAPVCDDDEITRRRRRTATRCPTAQLGELVTRGPYTIRGYYNAPQTNAEAFLPGGWYRMGDIVRRQGPLRLHRRPAQGPDQPRRREDQLRGGREPDLRPPEGQDRGAGGDARSGVRRKGLRLRRHQARRNTRPRRTGSVPAPAADRILQAARAAGGDAPSCRSARSARS